MAKSDPPFARGGFIPCPPAALKIDVAACILRAADVHEVRDGIDVCWRGDPDHLAAIGATSVPHHIPSPPPCPVWTITAEAEEALAALGEIRKRPAAPGPSPDPSESTP